MFDTRETQDEATPSYRRTSQHRNLEGGQAYVRFCQPSGKPPVQLAVCFDEFV